MLERAAKFMKRAKVRNTIRGVQQGDAIRWNDGMVEWWNGGMVEWWNGGMVEYSETLNALLYETKILQKWNCNEV